MNDEIKEILEDLRNKNMSVDDLTHNDKTKLLDCITNLQEENEKLTAESTQWEERTYCWQDRAEDLEIKIDKAIEYINQHTISDNVWFKDLRKGIILFEDGVEELLKILKGGDEE